ncbi:MAG: TPM domain-containing protein [Flavobacteriaceae bacterium]
MSEIKSFLSAEEESSVVDAIKAAELNTSGEIRVHIEEHSDQEAMARAKAIFEELHMHETELRNGVLFYVGVADHSFVILGDRGIDDKVSDDFWESTRDLVISAFKEGAFAKGLINGISEAGMQLKSYFPHQSDDENELSDEISKS